MAINTKEVDLILESYTQKLQKPEVAKNKVVTEGSEIYSTHDLFGNYRVDNDAYKQHLIDISLNKK